MSRLCLQGKELGRGHDASWDETPTVVQKTFTARDLPATFDIDVPTPKGQYPVYPRMLFIRREILMPDQSPLPLPKEAQPPKLNAGDELKSLPNPFLVGTQPPPPRVVRPTTTTATTMTLGRCVLKSGEAAPNNLLRWPKNDQEKVEPVVYLIGGELPVLPTLQNLAAARLVFLAVRGHDKAPAKVGVVSLLAPWETDKPFDFKQLGDLLSTVQVPPLPAEAADWSPPQEFKLDVTRQLRSLILGDAKFHGFALRIVPDRDVDDGWTVRVQLPQPPKIVLEIETFTEPSR